MNTSPRQTGRPRSTTARRPASAAPKRAAPRPPIQLAETGATDGSLSLVTESGTVIQLIPVPVAESLRYMMARLRLGDGVDLPERIGVTSALTGEGTTFLARSMALVLSNDAARRVQHQPAARRDPPQPGDGAPRQ